MAIADGRRNLLQAHAVGPAGPVPIRREPGFRISVPLRRPVDVLEADEGAGAFAARHRVNRHLVERRAQPVIHCRHGDAKLLRRRNPVRQPGLQQQTQRGEPPVALQHGQCPAVRHRHHDEGLDVEVPVRGYRLQQLVELGRPIQPRDDPLVGRVRRLAEQPRVRPVEPQPVDRDLRRRLKLDGHRVARASAAGCRSARRTLARSSAMMGSIRTLPHSCQATQAAPARRSARGDPRASRIRIACLRLLTNQRGNEKIESRRCGIPPIFGALLSSGHNHVVRSTSRRVADDAGLDVDARLHRGLTPGRPSSPRRPGG